MALALIFFGKKEQIISSYLHTSDDLVKLRLAVAQRNSSATLHSPAAPVERPKKKKHCYNHTRIVKECIRKISKTTTTLRLMLPRGSDDNEDECINYI